MAKSKKTKTKLEELAAQLGALSEELAREEISQLVGHGASHVRKALGETYKRLQKVMDELDPIKNPGFVFDPSNPIIAGRIIAITMIAQSRKPLEAVEQFYGSGIYAIYYNGDFPSYAPISKREHPIYVGKADPDGLDSKTAKEQGPKLSKRLQEHRRTIRNATASLRIEDFEYRALVVQTGYQEAAESYLIDLFKPLWNKETRICYGFGKHGDAPETRANLRSPWDTLHHGREWAHRDPDMGDASSAKKIEEKIADHLAEYPPLRSIDQVLKKFLDEMRAVS